MTSHLKSYACNIPFSLSSFHIVDSYIIYHKYTYDARYLELVDFFRHNIQISISFFYIPNHSFFAFYIPFSNFYAKIHLNKHMR